MKKISRRGSLAVGDRVWILRDIFRVSDTDPNETVLYAAMGDFGVIEEKFVAPSSGTNKRGVPYAKVRMAGTKELKTFRLTSLERVLGNEQR